MPQAVGMQCSSCTLLTSVQKALLPLDILSSILFLPIYWCFRFLQLWNLVNNTCITNRKNLLSFKSDLKIKMEHKRLQSSQCFRILCKSWIYLCMAQTIEGVWQRAVCTAKTKHFSCAWKCISFLIPPRQGMFSQLLLLNTLIACSSSVTWSPKSSLGMGKMGPQENKCQKRLTNLIPICAPEERFQRSSAPPWPNRAHHEPRPYFQRTWIRFSTSAETHGWQEEGFEHFWWAHFGCRPSWVSELLSDMWIHWNFTMSQKHLTMR